ncbi:MAG: T9SS type A sorting domain-containing protein [Candidatus Delongbacteria bacterium]|nr:T9SS type A sorting domain-containing protein [Candidatus Delongbacteria bacterium]MBN2835953.1 T9SS type A sorting domain-containing protein [Candidatus Delongbacteria bacterium]
MLKSIIFLILLVKYFAVADNFIWSKTFGTELSDGARDIVITDDNNFLMIGYSYNPNDLKTDLSLIKTDEDGNQLWLKKHEIDGWIFGNSVVNDISNEGFTISGRIIDRSLGSSFNLFIAHFDHEGNYDWLYQFGGEKNDFAEKIIKTSDNNYLVTGTTESFGQGEGDLWLLKFDTYGDTLWTKTFGSPSSDLGYCTTEFNGFYYSTGSTAKFDTPGNSSGNNKEVAVFKTDLNGNLVSENAYWVMGSGQIDYDTGYSICSLSDGNLCISGSTSKEGVDPMDIGVIKIDTDLNLIWKRNKEIGSFYDYGYTVCEATEDGILVAGSYNHPLNCTTDGYVLKYDLEGNEVYNVTLGGEGSDSFRSIKHITDNQFIITGFTNSFGNGAYDFWLVKYEDNPVKIYENLPNTNKLKQNYPNPFNPETNLRFELERTEMVRLSVFNDSGSEIDIIYSGIATKGSHTFTWLNKDISSGVYFCCLKSESNVEFKKMILMK